MFELEEAIPKWREQMAAAGFKRAGVLDELEAHLRDDIEQRMRAAHGRDQSEVPLADDAEQVLVFVNGVLGDEAGVECAARLRRQLTSARSCLAPWSWDAARARMESSPMRC